MAQPEGFVIREWGEGYWKWSCTQKGRRGQHSGIVGPPLKREDALRLAEKHWVESHSGPPVEIQEVDLTDDSVREMPREPSRENVSVSLVRQLRLASQRRRDQDGEY